MKAALVVQVTPGKSEEAVSLRYDLEYFAETEDTRLGCLVRVEDFRRFECFGYVPVQRVFKEEKNVRVNCVLPASTISGMTGDFAAMKGGEDKLVESTGWSCRLSTSAEQANAMAFLGSDMASYISGVMLCVDCGQDIEMISGAEPDKYAFPQMPMIQGIRMKMGLN